VVLNSRLNGVITLAIAANYLFDGCSNDRQTPVPQLDYGAAIGDTRVDVHHYSGGLEVLNIGQAGTDVLDLEGHGHLVINANCVGGTVYIRGNFTIEDNSGGLVTIVDDARFVRSEVVNEVWDELQVDHTTSGTTGDSLLLARQTADPSVIADAVWDELITDHLTSGSAGQGLAIARDKVVLESEDVEDAVWDAYMINHMLSGSMGQGIAKETTVVLAAGAVWDVLLADHTVAGSAGSALGQITGSGNIAVNHNYGGTDALRVLNSATNAPVDEVSIIAYVKADYDAGNFGESFVRARSITGSDGRWLSPMQLDAETYTLVFNKPGVYTGETKEITVS